MTVLFNPIHNKNDTHTQKRKRKERCFTNIVSSYGNEKDHRIFPCCFWIGQVNLFSFRTNQENSNKKKRNALYILFSNLEPWRNTVLSSLMKVLHQCITNDTLNKETQERGQMIRLEKPIKRLSVIAISSLFACTLQFQFDSDLLCLYAITRIMVMTHDMITLICCDL